VRDGVRLAADIYLPVDLLVGTRLPTVLHSTRYHRRRRPRDPSVTMLIASVLTDGEVRRYIAAGYAVVSYDARGSGASFGHRTSDPDINERLDCGDMCAWLVAQPWCDGRIGATGISYEGTTAECVVRSGHPAVRGAVVRFSNFDPVLDVMMPGGVTQSWFVDAWGGHNEYLDRNEIESYYASVAPLEMRPLAQLTLGVAPVDGDADELLLRQAVAEHAANMGPVGVTGQVTFRDDPAFLEIWERAGI
jgi:putative CocE/NonD family hydrolase